MAFMEERGGEGEQNDPLDCCCKSNAIRSWRRFRCRSARIRRREFVTTAIRVRKRLTSRSPARGAGQATDSVAGINFPCNQHTCWPPRRWIIVGGRLGQTGKHSPAAAGAASHRHPSGLAAGRRQSNPDQQ